MNPVPARPGSDEGSAVERFFRSAVRVLGSFQLATILLILLLLLTYLGTMEQRDHTIYDVQKKYFESTFLVVRVGGVLPIVLPGAYLLLGILLVNLVVGGIIRLRYGLRTIGVLIAHIGIILLLVGSFFEFQYSQKGNMQVYEGQTVDSFRNMNEWDLIIAERLPGDRVREYVVPADRFADLEDGGTRRFDLPDGTASVTLRGYRRNARPRLDRRTGTDFLLEALDPVSDEDSINVPGVFATFSAGDATDASAVSETALLWGGAEHPWVVEVGDRAFEVALDWRTWQLPFEIHLRRFEHEVYPGTRTPKRFSSYVTRLEDGVAQDAHITMNEPMRHRGYTIYQSSWGPQDARGDTRLFSGFSVVKNPSDRVPWVTVTIIFLGLLIHFILKLSRHIEVTRPRRAPAAPGGDE